MNPASFVTTVLPRLKSKEKNSENPDEQKEEISDVLKDLEQLGIDFENIQVQAHPSRRNGKKESYELSSDLQSESTK